MSPRERCDEIVRLIDEVLATSEIVLTPAPASSPRRRPVAKAPAPSAA